MSRATGGSPAQMPHRRAKGAGRESESLPARTIAREVAKHFDARGIAYEPAWLRRLVKRFVDDGCTTLADLHHRLDYADPTGDDAVRAATTGRLDMRQSWAARGSGARRG